MGRGKERNKDRDYRTQVERPNLDTQDIRPPSGSEERAERDKWKKASIAPIDSRGETPKPTTEETKTDE